LTATVKVNEGSVTVSSTTSMVDLIENCAHNYEGTFEYTSGNDAECTLIDDKSYLEFTLADGQKKVSVNGTWYDVNQTSHKAWVAVNGGTNVTTRIKGSKQVTAGVIYTIECTDVVDLGQTVDGRKIVWKTTNETSGTSTSYNKEDAAESVYKDEKYYTWDDAKAFGRLDNVNGYEYISGTADPFRLPTKAEFENLNTFANNSGFVTYNGKACKEFSNDNGALFLPAAGFGGGSQAGDEGYYWSSSLGDDNDAYILAFRVGRALVGPDYVDAKYSVRLVRGL